MSRSHVKNPIRPTCSCKSEKWDKRYWHKRFRKATRTAIKKVSYEDDWDIGIFDCKQVSDPWEMNKDGRILWNELAGLKGKKLFWKQYELFWCGKYLFSQEELEKFKLTMRDRHRIFGK